jgi:undecaprenyl-diphosphatase
MDQIIQWITDAFVTYGYWVVFFGVMLENAGIPLPGETILLAASFFAYQGHFSIFAVIVVAFIGAILGDNTGYWIGRRGGRPLLERYGRHLFLNEERLIGLENFFTRHGSKAVFFARFVTGFRVFTALFAGASRMHWPTFFLYNAAGALTWSTVIGSVGYLFGYSWETAAHWIGRGSLIAAAAVLIIIALFWIRRRLPAWQRALDLWLPRQLGLRELMIGVATLLSLGFFSMVAEAFARHRLRCFDPNLLPEIQRLHCFDARVLEGIHQATPAALQPLMNLVTDLGSLTFLGALLIVTMIFLIWRRHWGSMRLVIASGLLTPLLIEVLKRVFHRPRPELWPTVPEDSYSFPSGHALGSVVVYGILAYLIGQARPRWRPALWGIYLGLVAVIGFSRLYLGFHWPTDVMGGWAAGSLLLFGLIYWHEGRYRLPVLIWIELKKLFRKNVH